MTEAEEIPMDDTNEEISDSDSQEAIKKRSRLLSSSLYKRLGIVILILGGIILPLLILSFFFNAGQPDLILLKIEQITGFVLFGLAIIVGISLLFTARRLKAEEIVVLEPISDITVDESVDEIPQ
ncbi:MAG: hypothetical protein FK730_02370 [Asgard group archaeon]|nr:hypothetical protein [Asgard group archaeon]